MNFYKLGQNQFFKKKKKLIILKKIDIGIILRLLEIQMEK